MENISDEMYSMILNTPLRFLGLGLFKYTWAKPLKLEEKDRFPDSSFIATASTEGHGPSNARISSGSSWCAPVADGKHYLQVDFGRVYWLYMVLLYGDSNSPKWVTKYQANFTTDLLSWKNLTMVREKI